MSKIYDRVSTHVFNSKRDVEQRLANHNHKCNVAIIEIILEIAVSNLNLALDRMEKKIVL